MARENQGLQIALIIFVMLTIVLGITTFVFFRQYQDADLAANEAQQKAREDSAALNIIQEENNRIKALIGLPATLDIDAVEAKHKEDMSTYAGNYPEDSQFYSTVLPYLAKTVDDRSMELVGAKDEIQTLKDQLVVLESTKQPQVAKFQAQAVQLGSDLAKVTDDFNDRREIILTDQGKIQGQLQESRKKASLALSKVETKLLETNGRLQKLAQLNKQKSIKLDSMVKETFDVPDGEIRWVNQRAGTVWISLGQLDSLQRQTTFSVYPADTTNLTTAGKKASIEVTQILGPHTAAARVLEDQIADPIMIGDKIHTPIWSPGEQKRFALAGLIDIDGDGKSDQHTVRNLITMNGGVVDCEIDESGKRIGQMSVNTRYIVLGKAPDAKGKPEVIAGYTRMIGDADRLGIKKISLAELLNKMGWKNQSPVIRFGRGSNPADFRAKPADGVPRTSTGNVSDAFNRRNPPARSRTGRGSAY